MDFTCEQVARAALGEPAKRSGRELLWPCPRHNDQHPSLSLNPRKDVFMCGPCGANGKAWALAAFIAGSDPGNKAAVKAWLNEHGLLNGASSRPKRNGHGRVAATFVHEDAHSHPVCRALRHEPGEGGKDKSYSWERYEGDKWKSGLGGTTPPLYRLPHIKSEPLVFLFESHTDVERAISIGLPATTSGGSNSWRNEYADVLADKDVCLIPDNDPPGERYAATVYQSLHSKVRSLKVVSVAPYPDFRRWTDAGGTLEQLLDLYRRAPEFRPVSGAEILDTLMGFLRRFVSLTESQARAVSLWVAHTHAFDAANCTPYLAVNSAEKQSGKTRLLEVMRLLVWEPWFTGRVTAAVLVRKIDDKKPTLLLDESDAAFGGEKEYSEALRGVLNTGYRHGGCASICVGQGARITYRDFSTFCPKTIAGIGRLPDTVADRSIPIRLKRARPGETERFRERDVEREATEVKSKLAAWVQVNLKKLREARPGIPAQLSDRQADVCEPLLAIADLAGGNWPKAARDTLVQLCVEAQATDDSVGFQLLSDIKVIFAERDLDELASHELADALAAIETSPWAEWSKGKPLSPAKLARLLKPFEIHPDRIGGKASQVRGYALAWFQDAFGRYLPAKSVNPSTAQQKCGSVTNFKVSTDGPVDTLENPL